MYVRWEELDLDQTTALDLVFCSEDHLLKGRKIRKSVFIQKNHIPEMIFKAGRGDFRKDEVLLK